MNTRADAASTCDDGTQWAPEEDTVKPTDECTVREWPHGDEGGPPPQARSGWAWPAWPPSTPPARSRAARLGGSAVPAFFLLFLIQPLSSVFGGSLGVVQRVAVLATVVTIAGAYLYVSSWGRHVTRVQRVVCIGILLLAPIAMSFLLGVGFLLFWTYAVSPAILLLPRYVGAVLGLLCGASLVISTKIVNGVPDWGSAMVLVTLTVGLSALSALIMTVGELRSTQDRMARLAVAEERSRLARDLHDVLGHSLTTITVKAGLARRVLESQASLERAISEVRDVEDLARQAMADVRATVSGYRTASLPAELAGARAALSAAGIVADLPQAVDHVPTALREPFAYVIREGVTNVIRHSQAQRCEVRLGDTWLEVRDDGRAAAEVVCASREGGGGHGLGGLAERVGAVGGRLTAAPMPEGGFLLRVDATPSNGGLLEPSAQRKAAPGRPSAGLA